MDAFRMARPAQMSSNRIPLALFSQYVDMSPGDSFDDLVLKSNVPVIVDFHANWCGPCKLMAPIFKDLADEYAETNIKFVKLDTDDHEDTVDQYNIQGLPTFAVFKNGEIVATHSGAISRDPLKSFIDKYIETGVTL
jgi:thioredoxin 1